MLSQGAAAFISLLVISMSYATFLAVCSARGVEKVNHPQ